MPRPLSISRALVLRMPLRYQGVWVLKHLIYSGMDITCPAYLTLKCLGPVYCTSTPGYLQYPPPLSIRKSY